MVRRSTSRRQGEFYLAKISSRCLMIRYHLHSCPSHLQLPKANWPSRENSWVHWCIQILLNSEASRTEALLDLKKVQGVYCHRILSAPRSADFVVVHKILVYGCPLARAADTIWLLTVSVKSSIKGLKGGTAQHFGRKVGWGKCSLLSLNQAIPITVLITISYLMSNWMSVSHLCSTSCFPNHLTKFLPSQHFKFQRQWHICTSILLYIGTWSHKILASMFEGMVRKLKGSPSTWLYGGWKLYSRAYHATI